MRIQIWRVLATICLGLSCSAATAEQMPQIEGTNLSGNLVQLPAAVKGHTAVIIIGFSHDSQTQTRQWEMKVRKLISGSPSIQVYLIAVLEDAPRLIRGMIVHAMRGSTPAGERDHFLTVVHGENDLKRAAHFAKPDDAYVLLLDSNGQIQWRIHGQASDTVSGELANRLKALEH